jgi:hypothetical protein
MKNILRFVFLNIYSFFLLGLGIAVILIPADIFILLFRYLVVLWCIVGACTIISRYNIKKRQLAILIKRNKKEIRPDTFKAYLKTPCGQLLVSMAISNLRKTENYVNLSVAEWERVKHIVFRRKFGRRPNKYFHKKGV